MLNERGHIAKMLKRAQRRQSAANILVDKWTARLEALGPAPAAGHPLLWTEEPPATAAPIPASLTLPFEAAPMKEAPHEPS